MLLHTLRSWLQTLIAFYLLAQVAWWFVVGGIGSVIVVLLLLQGNLALAAGTGLAVFGSLAALAFLAWMTADARSSLPEVRRQHRKEEAQPDGNLLHVVAGPAPPPWMGTGPN